MADLIRIKRSDTTATPSTLAAGELAYSEESGNFFYGRISDGTPVVIGGKAAIDKLATVEQGAEVNSVISVAGKTGEVDIESADVVGLGSAISQVVENTPLGDLSNVSVPTPSTGHVLTFNGTNWVSQASGDGVTNFIGLDDTPANFTGAAGRIVKVNAAGDALEFQNGIDGGTF